MLVKINIFLDRKLYEILAKERKFQWEKVFILCSWTRKRAQKLRIRILP